jgi:hypothetical protein
MSIKLTVDLLFHISAHFYRKKGLGNSLLIFYFLQLFLTYIKIIENYSATWYQGFVHSLPVVVGLSVREAFLNSSNYRITK